VVRWRSGSCWGWPRLAAALPPRALRERRVLHLVRPGTPAPAELVFIYESSAVESADTFTTAFSASH